jgi:hypothetical protein
MQAVAIGRLDQQPVGPLDGSGINHGGIAEAPEIAGKDNGASRRLQLDDGGAENVAGRHEARHAAAGKLHVLAEFDRPELAQHLFGVTLRIERQGGLVPGKAVAGGEFGFALLEMAAVGQ